MKKLLSIALAALMLLAIFACTPTAPAQPDPTEAPAVEQPTEAPATEPDPAPAAAYEGIGLQIKNKTGMTIDEMYIYPVGEDMGASIVEAGWKDKDADPDNYEQFIYIVREAGKDMEVTVVFEDATKAVWPVGKLAMYDELSLKNGTDVANWEHEPQKDDDKTVTDLFVARGKTSDNFYPGYELIPVEFKNKTGKNITELYFYEEGGDPKAYNNVIDYLYAADGSKMASLMPGKAKEGGMYLFKCFIRPHAENYMIDVVFDDGATMTYPIEGWFKPDGDGNLPNEISLKSAEDKYDVKVQYDDGVPEPIDYLAESLAKGLILDQWYPTYAQTNVDPEMVETLRAVEAARLVPETEAVTEPETEPEPEKDASTENQIPAGYTIPEGYIGLALNVKNKTGKTINELYIYDMTEDPEVFLDYYAPIFENPWLDKDADGDNYEQNIYIIRKIADNYQLKVVYEDGTEMTADLGKLALYDKISLKGPTAEDVKHEPDDDPADIAAMDALIEAGVATDGHYSSDTAVLADIPTGYTGLHLMLKNKSGKEIEKVYLFPTGEDKGKNIFKTVVDGLIPTEDESLAEKPHEVFAFVHRETAKLGAMTLRVRYADGTEEDYELAPVEDYTVFTIKDTPDGFKQKVADDQEDIAAMDDVMLRANGASTDGVTFDPIA